MSLVDPFGRSIEACFLKDSPSLIRLGRLCGEEGFAFRWEPGKTPQLKSADGFWMTLDVHSRVLVLPMCRGVPRGDDSVSDVQSAAQTTPVPIKKEEPVAREACQSLLRRLKPRRKKPMKKTPMPPK